MKKRYYIIGIGGIAMASLAGLLKKRGYEVSGSDQEMYEPTKTMLKKLKIPVYTPYKAFHLKHLKKNDLVIVGNAIGRGNPELEHIISIGQPYRSVSDILLSEFIDGKKPIVIAGTHGKTTTTALVAWILECAGLDPTIFVGGIARNFDSSFKLGKGQHIVLEGDEYDTAFFDKTPKFWHYRPLIGLVNNIELDHIDIFKDLDAVRFTFTRFINLIPENGLLVANNEDKNVMDLVKNAKAKFHLKHFGLKHGDYTIKNIRVNPEYTSFKAFHMKQSLGEFKSSLIGKYNISNILGAITIASFIGVSPETIKMAISSFKGTKRRAEIIGEKNGIIVIDDYAHHPTAVRETLVGLKKKFHKNRLIAIFEPGSASSKRRVFEKDYIKSFQFADVVCIYKPFKVGALSKDLVFHGKYVVSELRKSGVPAKYFEDINKLLFHLKQNVRPGDVIVIMSCRGFDGLHKLIWDVL